MIMGIYINLRIFNELFQFKIQKLEREKIYGHKEVVAKYGDEECTKGYINETGMLRLTNGCTKFFAPNDSVFSPQERAVNKESLFNRCLDGYVFDIGEGKRNCYKYPFGAFLTKKVVSTYVLTNPDEKITEQVKSLLGKDIWLLKVIIKPEEDGRYEVSCKVYFFANENGIFASVCVDGSTYNYMYENKKVAYESEIDFNFEEVEIDFEDLW